MKAYDISNNIRTRCISPKRSSEVISHLVHNWYIFILFLKFPLSAVRNGKLQNAQKPIKLLDFTFGTARENSHIINKAYCNVLHWVTCKRELPIWAGSHSPSSSSSQSSGFTALGSGTYFGSSSSQSSGFWQRTTL